VATNVYIDGFNFYYGCMRGTPYRWLNLEAFCERLLPKDDVNRIRYFTAMVSSRPDDPGAPLRQKTYLRALATLPRVSIHLGHFLSNPVRMPIANPPAAGPKTVEVIKTEEKGSDVNLASLLLLDGFNRDCDIVVIISNDSDLREPVRIARRELGLTVGVANPHKPRFRSLELSDHAHFFKQVRTSALAACQFPPVLTDAKGSFHKPDSW